MTVERIEAGWRWLTRHPNHRAADERYERWLRWVAGLDPDAVLPPPLDDIVRSLRPDALLAQSEHATPDELIEYGWCGAPVWEVTTRHAGTKPGGEGTPLLLNHDPTAHGRILMTAPGFVRWCNVIDLIDWPLPRYSSHLVTCVGLSKRREQQRDELAEQMRWAKAERAERTQQRRERREAWFSRIDEEIGAVP